jgi:hypothetical protein
MDVTVTPFEAFTIYTIIVVAFSIAIGMIVGYQLERTIH